MRVGDLLKPAGMKIHDRAAAIVAYGLLNCQVPCGSRSQLHAKAGVIRAKGEHELCIDAGNLKPTLSGFPQSFGAEKLGHRQRTTGPHQVVEVKAVEKMIPIFNAQLLTHLKLTNKRVGFLVNFNVVLIKDGIKRIIN